MIFLRQSTASQEIPIGRMVDSVDGDTEKTALTIANTDIKIWKSGATTLASKNSGGATHIANGVYYAVLDATDTDTIGPLKVFVHVSGALAFQLTCVVLDEAAYDTMFAAAASFLTNFAAFYGGAVSGTVAASPAPALTGFDVTVAADRATGFYTGREIYILSGTGTYQHRRATSSTRVSASVQRFAFSGSAGQVDGPYATAPATSDSILIV